MQELSILRLFATKVIEDGGPQAMSIVIIFHPGDEGRVRPVHPGEIQQLKCTLAIAITR